MSATPRRRARTESGIVLVMVLFFVLLLASAMASFLRRVAIDAGVATNRDRAQEAESLARGGVRLGEAILLEDLRTRGQQGGPDSRHDLWARAGDVDLIDDPDVSLNVQIDDAAARINLNSFRQKGVVSEEDRAFLAQFFSGVIANMKGRPEELQYEPLELAQNLADWIDEDPVSLDGSPEEEIYARRDPPVHVPNRPLLSVDELRLIQGFDGRLVEALKPYVGVYPLVGGGGVNLNTAPPWVLIQMTGGSAVSGLQQLQEKDVRRIVDARKDGPICGKEGQDGSCTPISSVLEYDKFAPTPTERSNVFVVTAVARVVDVERTIEAVIDRAAEGGPKRLSWRVF
jgi:type II secretory pathway component PulK